MEAYVIPTLAIVTLGIVAIIAINSKRVTEKRKKDPQIPASALAKDGDPHRKDE
ncbi:hypothetical protein [Rhodosalinus halophilus]|uniref:hypothetical protein n=1 Tax=Rhodosalinus halophilus TaxID=2259333 RepID=UPI00131413F1|nr:hypothetical protein [Rhodosalinus halophilus]